MGFLAGANAEVSGINSDAVAGRPSLATSLAAGPVEEVAGERGDLAFQLAVYNAGDEQVTINLLSLGDWEPETSSAGRVSPGAWGLVEFSAPDDCSVSLGDPRTVHLRGRTPTDVFEQTLPLPTGAEKLEVHHQAVCGDATPVTATDLSGVWLLEEVHGADQNLVGTNLIRFDPDGTWVGDAFGELLGDDKAVWGTYRLDGRFLVTSPEGGHWEECLPGNVATWRVSIASDGRLLMALKPGSKCPDGEWDVWIAQRVLLNEGLPPPLANTARKSR